MEGAEKAVLKKQKKVIKTPITRQNDIAFILGYCPKKLQILKNGST
ncbi:hypothetical protein GCM10007876_36970 [Litoribrevibacter albus]|uniref:Uncharacterized protein n=1 Tax=Litoribrevibacter albus TaxID=1473156 RepID=A0AA37SBQ2_9GAMM|nr:hypothetical protein GCM10007876_36970 [Litoribrevibacter albus]